MRPTRTLAAGIMLAFAACSPDGPITAVNGAGTAPALPAVSALAPAPVCVDFGPPPPLGAAWGAPMGTAPGSWIFTENGVPVWIDRLFVAPGSPVYNYARIATSPVPIGSGQHIYLDRVDLRFDFSGVGFPVSSVTWEWYDTGAGTIENMAVNGGPLFIGDIVAPASVSGHPYSVSWSAAGAGRRGRSAIRGPVGPVIIGGQSLWIDRVCANP